MCSATLISTARDADKDTFGIVSEALSEPSNDNRTSSNASAESDDSITRASNDRRLRQNQHDTKDTDRGQRRTLGRSTHVSAPEALSEPSYDNRTSSNASDKSDGLINRPSNDRRLRQNQRDTQDVDRRQHRTLGRSPLTSATDAGSVHEQTAAPNGKTPIEEQHDRNATAKDVGGRSAVFKPTNTPAGNAPRVLPPSAAKARKRFRPNVAHHEPVSPPQQTYLALAVQNLSRFPETRDVAASISKCGTTRSADGRTSRTIKCGHPFCPRCRRAYIQRRVAAASDTFAVPRFRTLWWVTVLAAVLPGSPMDLAVRDPFEPQKQLAAPSASSIRDWVGPALTRARTELDECLNSLAPASLAADGSFEFDVLPVASAGVQKDRFLQALRDVEPHAFQPPTNDLFLLHIHMLVSASRSRKPVGRNEIAAALRTRFPHPHQVEVRPLDARKERHTNIKNLVSYALKTKTDFRAARVRDLALILEALGWRALAFRRRWTKT
jgi:hypothetical protein